MRLLGREGRADDGAAQQPAQRVGGPVRLASVNDPAAQEETVASPELDLLDLVVGVLPERQSGIVVQSICVLDGVRAADDAGGAVGLCGVGGGDEEVDGKLGHPSVTHAPERPPARGVGVERLGLAARADLDHLRGAEPVVARVLEDGGRDAVQAVVVDYILAEGRAPGHQATQPLCVSAEDGRVESIGQRRRVGVSWTAGGDLGQGLVHVGVDTGDL